MIRNGESFVSGLKSDFAFQAYLSLQLAFVVAGFTAGLAKFFGLLTDWHMYLAPQIASLLPVSPQAFILFLGGIELLTGLLNVIKPKVGSTLTATLLLLIIVNLLLDQGFTDIVLRDIGLFMGAVAFNRLSMKFA